jgi:hypothetical protein
MHTDKDSAHKRSHQKTLQNLTHRRRIQVKLQASQNRLDLDLNYWMGWLAVTVARGARAPWRGMACPMHMEDC